MRIESIKVGSRVEVKISGSQPMVNEADARIIAYDKPWQAVEDAMQFLNEALDALRYEATPEQDRPRPLATTGEGGH